MPVTSVAQANSKTAEFARLFDVFDRVATRRSRALAGAVSSTSHLISADDIANVPAEFAPVLKNLSTILSLRALRDEAHTHRRAQDASTSTGAYRDIDIHITAEHPALRDDADGSDLSEDVEEEEEPERPSFPLEERYPFTFKLMLHKLYDLDEWGDKIKHVVETSKSQFKPLAERVQNVVRDATASIKERRETRSGRPAAKSKSSAVTMPAKAETSRVLKKRCVGRRKSGPVSTGVWVYDAAVSVTEVVSPRSAVETTRSVVKGAGSAAESRVRHRSKLTDLEETHSRDVGRHKVDNPITLVERETPEPAPPQPSSPLSSVKSAQQIIETTRKGKSVVKKRSSLASIFASEPCKKATVKRPLCV